MPPKRELRAKVLGKSEDIKPKEEEQIAPSDYLSILKNEFFTRPFLGLLEEYLQRCNGANRNISSLLRSFKAYHPAIWKIIFIMDVLMRIVYFSILLLFVVRGLGLTEYIIEILSKIKAL